MNKDIMLNEIREEEADKCHVFLIYMSVKEKQKSLRPGELNSI